MTQLKIYVKN